MTADFASEKAQAAAWFENLRDQIISAFEALEDSQAVGPFADQPAGSFTQSTTTRTADDGSNAGGGLRLNRLRNACPGAGAAIRSKATRRR
ncbi:MAG: hypothetical protein ABF241_11795, partial [Yoonia sp.]